MRNKLLLRENIIIVISFTKERKENFISLAADQILPIGGQNFNEEKLIFQAILR